MPSGFVFSLHVIDGDVAALIQIATRSPSYQSIMSTMFATDALFLLLFQM